MGSGKSLSRTGDKFLAADLETVLRFLIDEAIRKGESRTAGKLVAFGIEAASRNGDAKAGQFYVAKGKESSEVARLHKQYETALKKLARDPDNATANEQKGRYLIVVQNDFDGALECWKMSDDDEYLDIVKDEAKPGANASFWRGAGRTWAAIPELHLGVAVISGRLKYSRLAEKLGKRLNCGNFLISNLQKQAANLRMRFSPYLAFFLVSVLVGCNSRALPDSAGSAGGDSAAQLSNRIYAVSYPLQFLTQQISGQEIEVLLPFAQSDDPRKSRPTREVIAAMQDSDLVIANGVGARYAKWLALVSPVSYTHLTLPTTPYV